MSFQKATRKKAKLKVALIGPAGSGKTYSALQLAKGLGGKIAVIDTERGSASLYADSPEMPQYDVTELQSYEPEEYQKWIMEAIKAGYETVVIDSLSHEWMFTKDFVSKIAESSASRNSFTAWSKGTPRHQALIELILQSPIHVIATMRAKTEWSMEEDEKGRSKPVKLGLGPDQRKGIEYEFTTIFEISQSHIATVSKDRTGLFERYQQKLTPDVGVKMKTWLESGVETPAVEKLTKQTQTTLLKAFERLRMDINSPEVKERIKQITTVETLEAMSEAEGQKLLGILEAKIREVEAAITQKKGSIK